MLRFAVMTQNTYFTVLFLSYSTISCLIQIVGSNVILYSVDLLCIHARIVIVHWIIVEFSDPSYASF